MVDPQRDALAGVRVLDFGIWRPVPYATQLLAEVGADVIKVEPPGGDPMRQFPELFAMLNANKRSIVLNLHDAADHARALELVHDADVVTEGFRPGVMDRLGLGWDTVHAANPRAVYCSISGFGATGPDALVSGHDINYQAVSGALGPEGQTPVIPPLALADLAGGVVASSAILTAYVAALRTGIGDRVDVSMTDVLASWVTPFRATLAGDEGPTDGLPTYGVFRGRDGRWTALGIIDEDHFWRATCDVFGLPHLRELDFGQRRARATEVHAALVDGFAARDRDEAVAALAAAGAPASPVLDRAGMLDHPALRARGTVTRAPGLPTAIAYPARFGTRPARWTSAPPAADEHAGATWHPRP